MEASSNSEALCNRIMSKCSNTVRAEDRSCSHSAIWIVDPFGSALKQTKDGDYHLLKSPVIPTWWHEEWQIRLNFFQKQRTSRQRSVRTTITKLKPERAKASSWKGSHHFQITAVILSSDEEYHLHDSYELTSEYSCSIDWENIEPLKITVEISFWLSEDIPRFKLAAFNIQKKLAAIQETEELLDFTIFVGDEERIRTSKTVLALASPVFLAMFSHDCKEKQTKSMHMGDVDMATVRMFLNFLYTGQAPVFTSFTCVTELLYISEKYEVSNLKHMCLEYIHSTFNDKTYSCFENVPVNHTI